MTGISMTDNTNAQIRDLEIMADAVNYRRWIYENISSALGKRVVECGAGIGSFTLLLAERDLVVVVDRSETAVDHIKRNLSGKKNVIPLLLDMASDEFLELGRFEPDTVICINVLEHVEDDARALFNMHEILTRGGKLALLVPAHRFLYGSIDTVVGHHRRYDKRELIAKLRKSGFQIKDVHYMNCIAAFGWFVNNRILRRTEESPLQVRMFDRVIVPWLRRVERVIRPPFGLSLIAIGEKG
jgi:SAM-dependent methyltransferase